MNDIKFFVYNDDNEDKHIPLFSMTIPARSRIELERWEQEYLLRNFRVERVVIKNWEELPWENYKEWKESQKTDKNNPVQEEVKHSKKVKEEDK